jgi:hypothetical protein
MFLKFLLQQPKATIYGSSSETQSTTVGTILILSDGKIRNKASSGLSTAQRWRVSGARRRIIIP